MARKPEAVFSDYIREHLPNVDISRVESLANLGFPDMVVANKETGAVGFLENKVVSRGLKIALRPHQASFLYRHWSYGCPAYLLVKHLPIGKRIGIVNLYHGGQSLELVETGLRVDPVARWPSNGVNWEAIRDYLSGAVRP
jgi:hypothetical protein